MERFFGFMPSEFIDYIGKFKTRNGSKVTVQAGSEGWTIIMTDIFRNKDNLYTKDVVATAEDNYKAAYERTYELHPDLEHIVTVDWTSKKNLYSRK